MPEDNLVWYTKDGRHVASSPVQLGQSEAAESYGSRPDNSQVLPAGKTRRAVTAKTGHRMLDPKWWDRRHWILVSTCFGQAGRLMGT
ncbi:unnamed protein product [Phytophthora fragariaefolia]|uniref:Unnamed protein product n=1 Tax=Phytophthora fragariaefolia TaxID=1490495 RepID=A0A9W6U5S0_9STRA|nr:unnamed protein product [Phytophthora fragariaefolia]